MTITYFLQEISSRFASPGAQAKVRERLNVLLSKASDVLETSA